MGFVYKGGILILDCASSMLIFFKLEYWSTQLSLFNNNSSVYSIYQMLW